MLKLTLAAILAFSVAIVLCEDITKGPPPPGKPWVPAWQWWKNDPKGWKARHDGFLKEAKTLGKKIKIVFFGDSITDGWRWLGKSTWDKQYAPLGAVNFGIGSDKTQHVLWRIINGEVEGLAPKLVVLKIGVNNMGSNTDEDTAKAIGSVVTTLRAKLPNAKVLLLGVLPAFNKAFSARVAKINSIIKSNDNGEMVKFLDMSSTFQESLGILRKKLYTSDLIHLSKDGYQAWSQTMDPVLKKMIL